MAIIRCKMCGGELGKNAEGLYVCQSCGSIQTFEENKDSSENYVKSSSSVPIEIYETTYKAASKSMEESDFEEAAKLFSRIEDYRDSAVKLGQCKTAIKETEQANIYEYACRIMASANSEKEYKTACNLFAQIESYKDASALKGTCSAAAEQCRITEVYEKACSLMSNSGIHFLSQAIELFNTIPNFKDSLQKRDTCLEKIKKQQQELAEKNAALKKYREQKNRKKRKIVLGVIFAIVIFVVLKVGISKIVHNPNNLDISITDMSSKYDSKYYYVYTDFTICNHTGATIDYIEITSYFKDKSDKSIGTMTSTFGSKYGNSSLNLKAGKKTIEETYLSERISSTSMSNLFVTLYNEGMDDLSVTYEITYIQWSDGHTYDR